MYRFLETQTKGAFPRSILPDDMLCIGPYLLSGRKLLHIKQDVILVFSCVTPMAHEVFLNFG